MLPVRYMLVFAVLFVIACALGETTSEDVETSGVPDCSECESQVEELTYELKVWQQLAEQCVDKKQKGK